MFIAEQQMVAAAVGLQVRGYRPFAPTFAAFFSRAYDFVRMAAISRAKLCPGPHAGVSIEDGPSQMAPRTSRCSGSSIRAWSFTVDPNRAAAPVRLMADHLGIAYMRTTRGARPLYRTGSR
jgi:transketolase